MHIWCQLMSSVHFCLTSKDFFICQKAFILGIFKAVRINPQKNIHFSDKVKAIDYNPLIPTQNESEIRSHFRLKTICLQSVQLFWLFFIIAHEKLLIIFLFCKFYKLFIVSNTRLSKYSRSSIFSTRYIGFAFFVRNYLR